MDRVYLAIIVSALLLLLGAAGVIVTKNADLMPPGRTVGVSGSR
jgi:NADH:ubiquinone oxidoreductase subunit K